MSRSFNERLTTDLDALRQAGTYKTLRHLQSPMGPVVQMEGQGEVIVLSSMMPCWQNVSARPKAFMKKPWNASSKVIGPAMEKKSKSSSRS